MTPPKEWFSAVMVCAVTWERSDGKERVEIAVRIDVRCILESVRALCVATIGHLAADKDTM